MNKAGFEIHSLIHKDSRLGTVFYFVSTMFMGAIVGSQTAENLSRPLYRYIFYALATVVCFLKWRQPAESPIIDPEQKPFVKDKKNSPYAWCSLFFFVALIGDAGLTGIGYFDVVETGPVSHVNNSLGLDVRGGDLDYTEYTVVGPLTAKSAEVLYAEDALENYFKFELRKTDNADSLTIEDVQITVKKFQEIPQNVTFTKYTPTMSASPFDVEYMKVIAVELNKKKSNALPWKFSSKYFLDDPLHQTVKSWGRYSIDMRSKFTARLGVKLFAKDPGLYTYNAQLCVRADMSKTQTIELFDNDQILLVLPLKETPTPLTPPAFAPRPKIQGFPVKRAPHMEV